MNVVCPSTDSTAATHTVALGIHDSRDGHALVFSIPENILLSSTTLQIILVNTIVHVYKPGNSRYNNNN